MADLELHDEVVDWFKGLNSSDRNRAMFAFDRLENLGHTLRMPFSKTLGDGLFELRFGLGNIAQRITYRYRNNGDIVLLTQFRKTKNNERIEVDRARTAAADCAKNNP